MPTKLQYEAATPILTELNAVASNGMIQAPYALEVMPRSEPAWHETQSYETAAKRLGLEQDEDGEWYVPGPVLGSRVEAGEGEDHDTGTVIDVDEFAHPGKVYVGWEGSGDRTWHRADDLTVIG